MGVDDLSNPWAEIRKLKRRISALERATPLQSASISVGGLRVISSDPGLVVEGLLSVTGVELIDGQLKITGTLTTTGDTDIGGDVTISGDTSVTGKLDVEGDATLKSDLVVEAPGKIKVGAGVTLTPDTIEVTADGRVKVGSAMTLNPTGDGGSVDFSNGARVSSDGTSVVLSVVGVGNVGVRVSPSAVSVNFGSVSLSLTASGPVLTGIPPVSGTGLPANVLYVTSQGQIFKADGN